jgi:peptide chain release factor 1
MASQRKGLIGTADRSERIRTYNFPQGRVTDHRVGVSVGDISRFMLGQKLDELVDVLHDQHDTQAMEELYGEEA